MACLDFCSKVYMEAVKWRLRHVSREIVANLTDADGRYIALCVCVCV
jgi:hypothetical protein